MGKFKNESSDQGAMDIQEPQTKTKKNKLIAKRNRPEQIKRSLSTPQKSGRNIIKQFSKSVNLKTKSKSLEQKQDIFQKVIKGLQDKPGIFKKNKKKQRVLLKKELRKHLQQQRIHRRKKSTEGQPGNIDAQKQIQSRNPQKCRKKQINERVKVAEFHQLMGAGLQNIRNLIANNSFKSKEMKQ